MIFATCGTSPCAFDRMMAALSVLPATDLTVQHGPAAAPPCTNAHAFLPFGRMVELMREADVVVSHAGVGSIMCAIQAGHVPVVFPRLKRYGETVDDHQAELATALARRGTVIVVGNSDELARAVASVPKRESERQAGETELSRAVRSAIYGGRARSPRISLADRGILR